MLRSPAEPECRGLRCASRVLNAIHYPRMGAVVISPMGRGQGLEQSRQRVTGDSSAKELGRSSGQRGVGLQMWWIRKGGWADGAETGRALDEHWLECWGQSPEKVLEASRGMGKAGEAGVSPGTEVRRSKGSQWGNEKLGELPGSRAPWGAMRGGAVDPASQGRGRGW